MIISIDNLILELFCHFIMMCGMKIQENVNLSKYTTFQLNAKARFFAEVKNLEDINECLEGIKAKKITFFILGGGANVAFVKNFPGLVIKISLLGKEIISIDKEKVRIKVAAVSYTHLDVYKRQFGYGIDGADLRFLRRNRRSK